MTELVAELAAELAAELSLELIVDSSPAAPGVGVIF